MATRLKTVQYAFPPISSTTNNTLTSFTQITLSLPESSKNFVSVVAHLTFGDISSATGATITTKTRELRLGAASYSTVNNANTLTNSGENRCVHISTDFTSYFNSNWSGSSMTCDFRFQINITTGTGTDIHNPAVTLDITYEYDDTSSTQVKTVQIPLFSAVGAIDSTAPASPNDVIPALDTYLPEASKTAARNYTNIYLVFQGNDNNVSSGVQSITIDIDGGTILNNYTVQGSLSTARWHRFILDASSMDTSSALDFIVYGTPPFFSPHVWLVVTYEFSPSSTTSVMNSIILPMEFASPMGGTASTDYQRANRELWIQESSPSLNRMAFCMHFDRANVMSGINARIGTGSMVNYGNNAGTVLGGGDGIMIRNDGAYTLVRGKNEFSVDVYNTDTVDLGFNLSGFWIINYTSDKHADGVGAHNHTCIYNILNTSTGAAVVQNTSSSKAINIPETLFFVNAIGTQYIYVSNSTGNAAGVTVLVERLSVEGGQQWEIGYADLGYTDPESGIRTCYSQIRTLFNRWAGDPDDSRIDLETARRWRTVLNNNCASFDHLDLYITYHTISYSVTGTVSGSGGGTVDLTLHRTNSGEKVSETSRTGNGSFSFDWYDDTEDVFVSAKESSTLLGRSDDGVP